MKRAAFLDRDGVINRRAPEGAYITRWEEMHILPGVTEAICSLNAGGFRVIVVTNQRCVAKGLLTAQGLEAMHKKMCDALAQTGATIQAVYYCPHDIHPGCGCRKPEPGMLRQAAREHEIDLQESWMIGDSAIDIEAGRRAGCKTAMLKSPGKGSAGDVIAPSLLKAAQKILQREEGKTW